MDGTIGDDLVVKPAPDSLRDYLRHQSPPPPFSDHADHWSNQWSHDTNISSRHRSDTEELPVDYAFLDEDDELDYNSVDGFPGLRSMRRRRSAAEPGCDHCVQTGAHIIYKRRDVSEGHESDYSEYHLIACDRIMTRPFMLCETPIKVSFTPLLMIPHFSKTTSIFRTFTPN